MEFYYTSISPIHNTSITSSFHVNFSIFNDMIANTKRGLNVAVIDETNGKVLESESFDTYTSGQASYIYIYIGCLYLRQE